MIQSKLINRFSKFHESSKPFYILTIKHILYITYRRLIKSNFDYHKFHHNNIKSIHIT